MAPTTYLINLIIEKSWSSSYMLRVELSIQEETQPYEVENRGREETVRSGHLVNFSRGFKFSM